MFCPKCGNPIQPGGAFCSKCGNPTGYTNPNPNNYNNPVPPPSPYVNAQNGTQHNTLGGVIIAKIIVVIALICFFFPFMTVSCAGSSHEITGTDMIFGDEDLKDEMDDRSGSGWFNIFLCGAGICGVLALLASKSNPDGGAITSGIAFVLLIIFRLSATSYYEIEGTKLKDFSPDMLKVEFGGALYFSMILFFAAAVIFHSVKDQR